MLSKNEIKLLMLLPSTTATNSHEDPIRCRSRVVPLSSEIEYEALSYVWGSGSETAALTIDGQPAKITKALECALKRIRTRDSVRTLWVDQLCINQGDDQEKANQVPLMGRIYSQARQCIIWLGEIRSDITLSDAQSVFDIIHFMSDYETVGAQTANIPSALDSEESLVGPMRAWDSICLYQNPWWRRLWTLQEAVLPSQACVMWGPLSIQWHTIVKADSSKELNPVISRVIGPHIDSINHLFTQVRGIEMTKRSRNPLDTAYRWSFRRASNPLDKVYGILGLFPPGALPRVQSCSYQLQPATVYGMFTADLISHHRSLQPIALRCLRNLPESTLGAPSWALDLAVSGQQEHIQVDGDGAAWFLMHTYNVYNACGKALFDEAEFSYSYLHNSIKMNGHMVDEIAQVGTKPLPDVVGTLNISQPRVMSKIREWYELANSYYTTKAVNKSSPELRSAWPESFWRGLLANWKLDSEYIPRRRATGQDIALAERFTETGEKNDICYSIFATICHRTMFISKTGFLGFGPHHLNIGDQVWIFPGGNVPFLLRPEDGQQSSGSNYSFIGPSYVHGIMQGEGMETVSRLKGITLV